MYSKYFIDYAIYVSLLERFTYEVQTKTTERPDNVV